MPSWSSHDLLARFNFIIACLPVPRVGATAPVLALPILSTPKCTVESPCIKVKGEAVQLVATKGNLAIFESAGEPLQCAERNRQTCLLLLHYSVLTQQAYLKCSGSLDQPLQTGAITDCAGGGELTCATAAAHRLQPAHNKTIADDCAAIKSVW